MSERDAATQGGAADAAATSQFDALLSQVDSLGDLRKALDEGAEEPEEENTDAEGDAAIQAEADEAADRDGDGKDGKGEGLMKSFGVTLEDGTKTDAVDATDIVKDLLNRAATAEDQIGTLQKALTASLDTLQAVCQRVVAQDKMLKALGNKGVGRKAMLTIAERPAPGAGAEPPAPMGRQEILAKSLSAQKAGRLTGMDCALIETLQNRGEAIPAHLAAILAAA